jgi:hypothetical protein
MRLAALVALIAILNGCASLRSSEALPAATGPAASLSERCTLAFAALDEEVARAGVGDAEATPVHGFPYLRASRLLASYRLEVQAEAAFREWVAAMQRLDREARLAEIGNLPAEPTARLRGRLRDEGLDGLLPAGLIEGCGNALRDDDLADGARRDALRAAAVVPDDYDEWKRVLGAYVLARLPFAAGVRRWQDETRAVFAQPLEALPVKGRLTRYTLAGQASAGREAARATIAAARARSALGIPDAQLLAPLLRAYAPVFEIDTATQADRIGRPVHGADGVALDIARPAIFMRVAHTRYRGKAYPQLVYGVWFPERPVTGPFDLLGGRLDAVLWRVTLGDDGAPLVFDSIHGCGCYHEWFPTPRARPRPPVDTLDEQAFVPQTLPGLREGERVVVRLAAGTHYVQSVRIAQRDADDALQLLPADDESLRRLPLPAGATRSLFRPDGIVLGTERGERWLFWPMGVREPGAMRQWGRHATAFVGRRHFDDADLVERYFDLDVQPR